MRSEQEIRRKLDDVIRRVVELEQGMRKNPGSRERYRAQYTFWTHEKEVLQWVLGLTDGIKLLSKD